MAGAGRRTFAPGEVLTATNVMNYLQDQAVMNFAGTAARGSAIGTAVSEGMVSYLQDTNFLQVRDDNAWHSVAGVQAVANATVRDSLIPTPNQGDKVFRSDLGFEQTYYAAWGTANPGGRSAAGWYDNQRNMGLVPIVPPTVNYSGGTATANTLGAISFTGVSSISLNNVFTAAYKNYRVIISNALQTSVDGAVIGLRFRASGTDSSVNYYFNGLYQQGTSTQGVSTGSNQAQWNMTNAYTNLYNFCDMDIYQPFDTQKTLYKGTFQSYGSNGGLFVTHTGLHDQTVSYDGLTIRMSSGNVTGTIYVYGYNV